MILTSNKMIMIMWQSRGLFAVGFFCQLRMLKLRKQMPLLRQRKLTPSLLEYLFTTQVSIMATSDNEDVDFLKDQGNTWSILHLIIK